jgi:hypothetical protein
MFLARRVVAVSTSLLGAGANPASRLLTGAVTQAHLINEGHRPIN